MAGCDRSFDLMPFLQVVVDLMEVQSICRFRLASSTLSGHVEALRSTVLGRRFKSPSWPWQKAHSIEAAALHDEFTSLPAWTPGPNKRNKRNVLFRLHHALCASSGTDLQAFQGMFRTVSTEGVHSSWISVRVSVGTPDASEAFLALYSSKRSWGFTNPVLVFNCKGLASEKQRCFSLQTEFGTSSEHHVSHPLEPVGDRAYDVGFILIGRERLHRCSLMGFLRWKPCLFKRHTASVTPPSIIGEAPPYRISQLAASALVLSCCQLRDRSQARAVDPCPRKLSVPSQSWWQ
jgi:hypothetical protein